MNTSANRIHNALQNVANLRQRRAADPALAEAVNTIKRFQARRFQATYTDLLDNPRYKTAAQFFLQELYSDKDYAQRDQQFARIASTISKLFPEAVVNTAAALTEVHSLTETLDDLMAQQWLASANVSTHEEDCAHYIRCWRQAGDAAARHKQLDMALLLGEELNRLTRKVGLRTLLRVMRGPATAAGLSSLQGFLEAGFDAFANMLGADDFMATIRQRETTLICALFDDELGTANAKLRNLIALQTPGI